MTLRQHIDDIGGRKFVLAAFVVVSATAMHVTGSLSEAAYQAIVLYALGLYSIANVGQKATAKPKETP